jgi:uncharacterized protein
LTHHFVLTRVFLDDIIPPMSHQPVIDGFEFATAGATQQGILPLDGFARLRDMLASAAGEVSYAVEGMLDGRGRPALRVKVRGTLQLRCQRCLEALPFAVTSDEMLVLAATQAEIDADPADPSLPDRLLAGEAMSVRNLVEDELILALPYAPRHEACEARAKAAGDEKVSPFAGLRGMLRGKH